MSKLDISAWEEKQMKLYSKQEKKREKAFKEKIAEQEEEIERLNNPPKISEWRNIISDASAGCDTGSDKSPKCPDSIVGIGLRIVIGIITRKLVK